MRIVIGCLLLAYSAFFFAAAAEAQRVPPGAQKWVTNGGTIKPFWVQPRPKPKKDKK
jgi:hypothetical protein